jgi:hypothetical protein
MKQIWDKLTDLQFVIKTAIAYQIITALIGMYYVTKFFILLYHFL